MYQKTTASNASRIYEIPIKQVSAKQKNDIIENNLTSQSLVIKSLCYEATNYITKICQTIIKNLSKNNFNFVNFHRQQVTKSDEYVNVGESLK